MSVGGDGGRNGTAQKGAAPDSRRPPPFGVHDFDTVTVSGLLIVAPAVLRNSIVCSYEPRGADFVTSA